MSQEYTPVTWVDEEEGTPGTLINKARLDQMQSAHHYADGFEEVDTIPTADPGVDYHKIVYCTVDKQFYRWTGSAWEKDIDDDTKALLLAHEADHANPHVVTKAQVGLGNVDNKGTVSSWQSTVDNDHIPTEKLVKDSLDAKVDDAQIVSAWQSTPDNVHIPSEALVKGNLDTLDTAVAGINAKIPAQASSSNQLADKNFVNSSIATNTANFLGTYDAETDLGFTSAQVDAFTDPPDASTVTAVGTAVATKLSALGKTVTNNDYVFVTVDKSTTVDTDWYWRFKYDGSAWIYEFTLNHSSFTSVQWAAINSGITAQLVDVIPTLCRKYSGSASVATSSWAASGITAYPYKADISVTGITANDYPTVAFGQADAASGNYSPECDTSAGTLTIYARATPSGSITITYMIIQDVS